MNPIQIAQKFHSRVCVGIFSLATLAIVISGIQKSEAALTPTLFYSAGTSGGTPAEGNGSWANSTTSSYAYWRTSITSTAATSPSFGNSQSATVVQFGGLSSGTAGSVNLGSSTGANPPIVGAIKIVQANSGGYTFTQKNGSPIITLYGVNDGTNSDGIYVSNGVTAPTLVNNTGGITNVSALWFNNAGSSILNIAGPVSGAALTTAGTITLNGANTFAGLTVNSGTTTIGNSGGLVSTNAATVASGATLVISNASVTTTVTNSGTLNIGVSSPTVTNSLTTSASLGSGAINIAGSSSYQASLTNTYSSQSVGALALNGYATVTTSTNINTTALTISSTGNIINYSPLSLTTGTYQLIDSTAAISGTLAGNLSLYIAGASGTTVGYGNTASIGRTTYQFTSAANNLELIVGGGAFNLIWSGAASSTWDYTGTNWQTNNAGTPTGSNIATFAGDNETFQSNATVAIQSAGVQAGSLTITNASGTVAFTGTGAITNTGTTLSGAGNFTVANPFIVGAGGITASGGGTATLNGAVTNTGGVAVNNNSTLNFNNSADSITGGFTVTGGGTLSSGANNALGNASNNALSITNGTLTLGGNSDKVGAVSLNGGIISGNGSASLTISGLTNTGGVSTISANIAGTTGLTVAASSTLTLSGVNSSLSGTVYNNGTLVAGSTNPFGSGVVSNAVGTFLDLNGETIPNAITNYGYTLTNSSTTLGVVNGALQNGAVWFIGLASGHTIEFNGNASGSHGVSINGGGTVELNNQYGFSGSQSAAITAFTNSTIKLMSNFTFTNSGSQYGSFHLIDATLNLNGMSEGAITNVQIGNTTSTNINLYNDSSTAATLGSGTTNFLNLTQTNARVGAAAGDSLTIGSTINDSNSILGTNPGTLEITGGGTVTLSGSNSTYATNQVDSGSTEKITGSIGASNGITVAGTLDLGGTSAGSPTLTLNGGTISNGTITVTNAISTAGGTIGATLSGAAAWSQGSGTTVVTGTNTAYTGAVAINGGVLRLTGSLGASSDVTVNSGGTLAGSGTISGNVTNSSGGTIAPGDPQILTMGSLKLNAGSTTILNIADNTGTNAGTDFDQINVTGALRYNGTLQLNIPAGSVMYSDTVFNFSGTPAGALSAVSVIVGGATTYNLVDNTGVWSVWYPAINGNLQFTENTGVFALVPEPSSFAMFGVGLTILGATFVRRRKNDKDQS